MATRPRATFSLRSILEFGMALLQQPLRLKETTLLKIFLKMEMQPTISQLG